MTSLHNKNATKSKNPKTVHISYKPSSKHMKSLAIIPVIFLCLVTFTHFASTETYSVYAQGQTQNETQGQNQGNQSALDCTSISANISERAVPLPNPNGDVCDSVIMRQAPQIMGHNGTVLNKFLAIGSLFEVSPAPANMSTNNNNAGGAGPLVVAMGEFGLLQAELKPMLKAISSANWNITAVHNHPILENPPMIFVHWDTLGPLNMVVNQTKGIVTQFEQLQQQQGQQTNNANSTNPLDQLGKSIGGALGLE
ncbi:MAG: DUF1259 domain-containing protein [Thermoproteota archaeon]|nr:DUF1259 domain-containing protein [Thermoproteota archaeon]